MRAREALAASELAFHARFGHPLRDIALAILRHPPPQQPPQHQPPLLQPGATLTSAPQPQTPTSPLGTSQSKRGEALLLAGTSPAGADAAGAGAAEGGETTLTTATGAEMDEPTSFFSVLGAPEEYPPRSASRTGLSSGALTGARGGRTPSRGGSDLSAPAAAAFALRWEVAREWESDADAEQSQSQSQRNGSRSVALTARNIHLGGQMTSSFTVGSLSWALGAAADGAAPQNASAGAAAAAPAADGGLPSSPAPAGGDASGRKRVHAGIFGSAEAAASPGVTGPTGPAGFTAGGGSGSGFPLPPRMIQRSETNEWGVRSNPMFDDPSAAPGAAASGTGGLGGWGSMFSAGAFASGSILGMAAGGGGGGNRGGMQQVFSIREHPPGMGAEDDDEWCYSSAGNTGLGGRASHAGGEALPPTLAEEEEDAALAEYEARLSAALGVQLRARARRARESDRDRRTRSSAGDHYAASSAHNAPGGGGAGAGGGATADDDPSSFLAHLDAAAAAEVLPLRLSPRLRALERVLMAKMWFLKAGQVDPRLPDASPQRAADVAMAAVGPIVFLLWLPALRTCLQAFNCVPVDAGGGASSWRPLRTAAQGTWLLQDMREACYQAGHSRVAVPAGALGLAGLALAPLFVLWRLHRGTGEGRLGELRTACRLGFFYLGADRVHFSEQPLAPPPCLVCVCTL